MAKRKPKAEKHKKEAPALPQVPRKPGRPSTYDPSFCGRVVEFGSMGKSRTWMAAEFGVCRDTIYEWEKQHPEFSDALARAKTLEQRWWEDAGQTGLFMVGFSAQLWSRSMAARFPEDWRETSRVEATGKNGGPIETKDVSDIEAAQRVAYMLGRAIERQRNAASSPA